MVNIGNYINISFLVTVYVCQLFCVINCIMWKCSFLYWNIKSVKENLFLYVIYWRKSLKMKHTTVSLKFHKQPSMLPLQTEIQIFWKCINSLIQSTNRACNLFTNTLTVTLASLENTRTKRKRPRAPRAPFTCSLLFKAFQKQTSDDAQRV